MPEAPVEGPLGSVDAGRPAVELVAWDIERLHSSAVLLPQVAELVTSEAPLSQLLASICQRAASVFGARRGSVFLIDDGRLVPRMSALADGARDSTSWPRFLSAREVPALVERVLQDGRPQLAPTSGSPLIAGWWADTFGIGSAMAVPIGPPAGVVGVLALDSEGAGAFGEDEVRRVSEAAAPLGAIIQWAQRAEGRQVEMVVAGAVRRLLEGGAAATTAMEAATAVARAIGTALGAARTAVVYFPDPDLASSRLDVATLDVPPELDAAVRRAMATFDPAESPAWQHVRGAREPHFVGGSGERPLRPGGLVETLGLRSYASIPVFAADALVGRVVCGDASRLRRWGPRDRYIATQLALESGLVMDGGRLRELERAHRARLAHQATHDPLTGLANRGAFHDHLARALAGDGAVPRRMAVLLLDLDRFKEVNDTLGHHRGDALLSQVAHRLVVALGTRGFVARLGGDEFAAVVPAPPDGEEPEAAAARVSAALSAPFMVSGTAVEIGASIGIVRVPGHGEEVDLVLEHADAAMYQAKRGGLPYASYRLEDDQGGARRLVLAGELHGAMAGDELVLHYQPEVDLRTGRVVGVEALVRWDHPRLGLLPPAEFIPLAEATGQVRAITTWVLDHAAAQCVAWLGAGLDLPVSVNMSARDLTDADFPARVAVCLAQHRLPAHLLSLELTEGAPLVHGHLAVELVGALRALGVRVSLDDFGTGYSSLAHLESLPVDEIKIDRSLVVSGMASARSPVLRAIVALGRELGIAVVAEGVESANVAHRLLELGCNRAQGHHFAPSLPAADLEAWLRARQADLGVLGRRDAPWLARARGGRRAGDGATRPVARPPS